MKAPLDPPRLIDSADADPVLRNALRVIREVPSAAALGQIADGAERAVREAVAGKTAASASTSLAVKLLIATVAGSAIVYLALPSSGPARKPGPQATSSAEGRMATTTLAESPSRTAPLVGDVRVESAPSVSRESESATAAADIARQPAPDGKPSEVQPTRVPTWSPGSVSSARTTESATNDTRLRDTHSQPAERTAEADAPPAAERSAGEMDLLEDAQQALSREPRRALDLLTVHRSTYPRSKFGQERDVLMLEAFLRLHDTASLKAGARAFLERYPHSPHRARVDKLLDGLHAR